MRYGIFFITALVLGLACSVPAAWCGSPDFSAAGMKLLPAPTGHVPGKDNGPGTGTHNTGEDCGICHRPGGKAPVVFTISGTLYEDRAGRRPLAGGEIILQDKDGNVISMTSNKVGNFWSYTKIASNPESIASHGGITEPLYSYDGQNNLIPADPDDSRTWQYKAWVKSGTQIRHMVTIAPVGGSTDPASRMSCNMHHAGMGSRGGLWGTGKPTLPSYPRKGLSFSRHILPITRNKCVPCHIPGATLTRLATRSDFEGSPTTVMDHSGGLDLTSYSGSTVNDGTTDWVKKGVRDVAAGHASDPDSSPLLSMTLRRPDGSIVHPGGAFWSVKDADYRALRQWIAEGAQDN